MPVVLAIIAFIIMLAIVKGTAPVTVPAIITATFAAGCGWCAGKLLRGR